MEEVITEQLNCGQSVRVRHAAADGKVIIPMQFFGLGDIIFCMELARRWIDEGYRVIWPAMPEYVEGLNRAYPEVTFADYNLFNVNWNRKERFEHHGATVIPLRWSYEITKQPFTECMKSKYTMFGLDWRIWKDGADWIRNKKREMDLMYELNPTGEPFILINENFTTGWRKVKIKPKTTGLKTVYMVNKPGYSLFDWAFVLEEAKEVHTVSTSLIYLLELLKVPSHIYVRRPLEANHKNYDYILSDIHYLQP